MIAFISPLNKPSSRISKEENVPPKAIATAHIFIESEKSIIVFRGGLLLIMAATPAKRPAPKITPKAIKKL